MKSLCVEGFLKVGFYIPVTPIPWAAPKFGKGVAYDIRQKDKQLAKFHIQKQYKGDPFQGYVVIHFFFVFPVPKSATKKQRKDMVGQKIFPTKCDCTNLQKLYEDCLKKIVINDDRNVVMSTNYKCYSLDPCVIIIVQDYEEFVAEHTQGLNNAT